MVYYTVKQPPTYHQMTLDEFLFEENPRSYLINDNETNTRTYKIDYVSPRYLELTDIGYLMGKLKIFNEQTEYLREKPRKELYYEFYIPKKSGGLRKIDAPCDELKGALRALKDIFENDFKVLYHTTAFAYIRNRCTIDAIKRHQANESNWFAKFDLSNFFGSTTLDFVMKMFSMIFPFSEIVRSRAGKEELRKALELAFLDGGLPQGTPISPFITNTMMIPIDHTLSNGLRDFNHQRFVYTRYADDFIISSRYTFGFRKVEKYIVDTLKSFDAPFTINSKKTRYGSRAGSNWNLGIVLNKDNQITVSQKKKKRFEAMLSSYVMDKQNGVRWDLHDIQVMEGLKNYYRMVEGETIDKIVEHLSKKFNFDILGSIKEDLRSTERYLTKTAFCKGVQDERQQK